MKNKMKKLQQLKLQKEIEEQRRREAEIDANPWDFSADWAATVPPDVVVEENPEQMDIENPETLPEQMQGDVSVSIRQESPEPIDFEEPNDANAWDDLPEFPSNNSVPGLDEDNSYDPQHPGWPAEEQDDMEIAGVVSSINIDWS